MVSVVSTLPAEGAGVVIGTHDGTFHCDECLAVGLLLMVPEFSSATVLRSRDPSLLEQCAVVVDVGGRYDAAARLFDHHQRGFEETLNELGRKTTLSSAGLTYRHYGRRIVETKVEASAVNAVYARLYAAFVEHVDGIDNGQEAWYTVGEARYDVSTTLSRRVGMLNPRWNEKDVDVNERFRAAVELCAAEFLDHCREVTESWLPARGVVQRALAAEGQIVDLETYCPWQAHIFDLETRPGLSLYVLYPDTNGGWRVQAVPFEEGSFQCRLALPAPWRGLRDGTLSAVVGVPDCVFVHRAGFIGGAKTKVAAMALATKALEFHRNPPSSA